MAKILIGRKLSFLVDSVTAVVSSSALPTGAATEVTVASILAQLDVALSTRASQATVASILAQLDVALSTRAADRATAAGPFSVRLSDGAVFYDAVKTGQLPALLVGGRLDTNIGAWLGSTTPTVGQKTMASSLPVVIASDQSSIAVTGTVTANQGTPAVVGNAWPTKVSDGVDTAGISTVGAAKALKVDVVQSVGSAGSTFGVAFPATGTAAGFTDGTNMQGAKVFDADTGVGTELVLGSILRKSASGGSVEAGTSTDPLRIDPTGTTTQPVSDAGGSLTVDTPQLPAALVGGRLDENLGAWLGSTVPTVGQKAMASSLPVVIALDQSAVSISGTVTANQGTPAVVGNAWFMKISDGVDTVGISTVGAVKALKVDVVQSIGSAGSTFGVAFPATGTAIGFSDGTNMREGRVFDADTGVGTEFVVGALLRKSASGGSVEAGTSTDPLRIDPTGTTAQPVTDNAGSITVDAPVGTPVAVRLSDGALFYDSTKTGQLPAVLVGGRLDTNIGAWLGSTAPTVGQKTMADSVPVVIASDQSAIPVTGTPSVVGTHANAWSSAAVLAGGNSASIDCQYTPHISAFGTSNGSTTISLQVSQDNVNFYTASTVFVGGGGGDFGLNVTIGARYIRLQSSVARTITATIAGKD